MKGLHIGHRHISDSVTTHTGNFSQNTLAIGHQADGTPRPHIGHRHTSDSVTKHTEHFGEATSAISHQAHGTPHEGSTHRPPTHLGLDHHTHGKLRPRHIGHRSPSTGHLLKKPHIGHRHTSDSVTKHTGQFGQDTSATSHQAHGTPPEGATHRPPRHLGLGHQTHGTLWPRHIGHTSWSGHQAHVTLRPKHIGHRSPSTRDTSCRVHTSATDTPPGGDSVTTHTGNFGQDTLAIGHQAHGTPRPHIGHRHTSDSVTKHTGHFGQDTSATSHQAHGILLKGPHIDHTSATETPRDTSANAHW